MTVTLSLSVPEVNAVLQGLAQLPYGAVADLIANLKTQAEAQLKPPTAE